MAGIIGTYDYTYGNGTQVNRQIQFSRTGAGPATIQAQIFSFNGGIIGNLIGTIQGNQIDVEMQSTSQKANAMMLARASGQKYTPIPDAKLSSLSLLQQNGVMGSLSTRRIEVDNTGSLTIFITS